jgi:PAS domain S-box-containing protein
MSRKGMSKKGKLNELLITNLEVADELLIANKENADELIDANIEKAKRAKELVIANVEKAKRAAELVIAKVEKVKHAAELVIANKELAFQNSEKQKRAAELVVAKVEKQKRAAELVMANIEKQKRAAELVIAKVEKAKHAAELVIANKELAFQNSEKQKRAAELVIAKVEKAKRAAELVIANVEKAKRAAELINAKVEKAKHAAELVIANKELVLANKQEKLAKEKYIELYNFAPTGYFTLTREGKIIELNLFASQILNKEHSFLKDRWFGNFVSDGTKPIFNHFLEQVFKSKTKQLCDVTLLTDSDLPKYVYLSGIVTKNAEQCLVSIDDISERKKAEEELEKSEMLLKSVINSSENLILVVNKDLKILMSNWKSPIYAGSTEFPIGSHCYEAFIHRDSPCESCHVFGVFNTGKPIRVEYYNQNTKLFKEVNAYPIFDEGNNVTMVVENVQDITERKQIEKKLVENESSLRNAQVIAQMGSWEWDMVTQKTKWSDNYYTISGFKSTEVEPSFELFRSRIHPDDVHFLDESLDNLMKDKKPHSLELRSIQPDGTFKWIQNNISPIVEDDKLVKLEGVIIDITESKQDELELIKAKEKAEESDRLKSAFLTNMSHEIRTPMNGILGFAELLKEPNLSSDEQQDYIQTMQISGARMLNTINNIIDVSKIESGLTKVDIKETNLNEKIEFTYKFFKPEVEIKGLQLLFKNGLPSKEAIIKTDNEKVYAILTNLVKNAIKFTYDGSIEFGYEKKGDYLEFFVKDTGIGVPQNQKEIIFERFRQGSESHNRGYEGSGLGLSIAKSYVEMLGGQIWVDSEEGIGSTFYFTIPYNAVSEKEIEIINAVSAEHKEVELKRLKILVVEDDEISYSLLTRMLQKISYEVLHAMTGVQAIEACRDNPDLDLVLMDIRMPNMDGNEATHQIRQFNKDVIIIAQTAYGFSSDREKTIEAGCNDYISKPINMTLLYELINKHCNKSKIC